MENEGGGALSFNELIMGFHAGQAYVAWFRPEPEEVKKIKWQCAICSHVPPRASMWMLSPVASLCDGCRRAIDKF